MSYILKALRKAEEARQGRRPVNPQTTILYSPQPAESKRGLLLTLLLCNLVLLVLFLFYLWQSSSPVEPVADRAFASDIGKQSMDAGTSSPGEGAESTTHLARQVKPGKEPASTIAEMVKQRQVRKRPGKAASGVHPPVGILQGGAQQKSVARNNQGDERHPQYSEPGMDRSGVAAPPVEEPAGVVAMLPVPPPLPKTGNVVKTRPAQPLSPPIGDPLPMLNELPYSIRRKFPKLNINVYVYSNDPRERFMIVDMVRFQEGQKMTDKIELKEIRPDDFVVSFEGRTFRVPRP